MPNRIIKESLCFSDDIDSLTPFEETVFVRLIVNVDDYGRLDARPALLRNLLFRTKDSVTRKAVDDAIHKLVTVGLVRLYEVDGKPFLSLPKWEKHQQVRAKKSKYPAPEVGLQSSDINCNQPQENVPVIQSESVSLSNTPYSPPNGESRKRKSVFIPPSLEDIKAYCLERKNHVNPKRFFDFFEESGWVDSNGKQVRNWKQKIITWESYDGSSTANAKNDTIGRGGNVTPIGKHINPEDDLLQNYSYTPISEGRT